MDVFDRFARHAEQRPSDPAVVVAGVSTSFGNLMDRVRSFAAYFGETAEPRILIALPQSVDAYAIILAATLAGGYHTPLNLAAPLTKLKQIAKILQPDIIVGAPKLIAALGDEAPRALLLDPAAIDPGRRFVGQGSRHHLAYVLFTSGSTGVPKGVMVPRAALNHYVDWLATFGIGPGDRVAQHPNLAFDISMTDIFGALCFGAALYPLAEGGDRLLPARFIARHGITVWNSTPSVVSLMMQARQVKPAMLGTVRLFNFCGEPLLPEHVRAVLAAVPAACIHNTYGPTEATVSVTCLPIVGAGESHAFGASVALGPPIGDMALHLVGGAHPDEGEIVITGPQLADGYWHDPERTAAAFGRVDTPAGTVRGYYTGDWAERVNGHIFFKERIDFQVKVRGHRIELDEVAAAIRACGWPVACVFKRGEMLAAVIERVPGQTFDETTLRDRLANRIEAHAIPDDILEIEHMPRNDNDKLDRAAAVRWFEIAIDAGRRALAGED